MVDLSQIGGGSILWSRLAREDLREVHDRSARAEIIDIAERELQLSVESSDYEGSLQGYEHVFWRRAIPAGALELFHSYELDTDEYTYQACDYVYIYRALTPDEKILHKRSSSACVVLRVAHNRDLVKLLPDQLVGYESSREQKCGLVLFNNQVGQVIADALVGLPSVTVNILPSSIRVEGTERIDIIYEDVSHIAGQAPGWFGSADFEECLETFHGRMVHEDTRTILFASSEGVAEYFGANVAQ